ncbi:30S ribosomal protein S2 [Flammeovirgaceae bacterium SG7u.111]|nr:30S ribosomal protein S2 [Flammeovirgaceae bacterium SG7u.132]WPO36135.1 30S ribosomal protein S2 [Flammeovirgaceae bacterium SG7u.111]
MQKLEYKDLLDAGVHFGHLTRKWNPKMAPYIFMERNGIHIIDLNKTLVSLDSAANALKNIVKSGRKVMFVATKKQAKQVVAAEAARLKMPFVTERWLGGMLTNFATVRKSIKKMSSIEKLMKDEAFKNLAKKERLMKTREKEKLERVLGGIADQNRLPAALFVVDVKREHIAIKEANKLNIPVFAIVDTNSDPTSVDFSIPANDDAFKSVAIITQYIGQAIEEGLMERKKERDESKLKEAENEKRAVDEAPAKAAAPAAPEAVAEKAPEAPAAPTEEASDAPEKE